MSAKKGYTYMVTNKNKAVLYTGVTAYLKTRIAKHKNGDGSIFTSKYKTNLLVWYEEHADIRDAIKRESQIKNWKREWKEELINKTNPEWNDLFFDL